MAELAAEQERLREEWVKYLGAIKPEQVRFVLLDPALVVERVCAALLLKAGAVGLHLRVQEEEPPVEADERLLREALFNLGLNGLEARCPWGGNLTLSLGCDLDQGESFLRCRTTAPVSIPINLDHLFDPAFSTSEQGNGYGLSIARRIAHAHHGELPAKSRVGDGTVFHLDLQVNFEVSHSVVPLQALG